MIRIRLLKLALVILVLGIFFLFNLANTEKAVAYFGGNRYFDDPPASYTEFSCGDCPGDNTCWNSWAVGETDCGDACEAGSEWTKYDYVGCYVDPDDLEREQCFNIFDDIADVCSTADKCYLEPYLRAGYCECIVGGTYKTCCTNTSPSYVSGSSCTQLSIDNTNPPYEGVCPAGTTAKFCGFGDYPACGQAACGPTSTCDGCTYPETCTTSGGLAGVRTCKGKKNSSNVCVYDAGCSPDCTTCTATSTPPPGCTESLCTAWSNSGGCGAGSCTSTEKPQARTCPAGSTCSTSRCNSDSSCSSSGGTSNLYIDPNPVNFGSTVTVTATSDTACTYTRVAPGGGFDLKKTDGSDCWAGVYSSGNPKDSKTYWWRWKDCRTIASGGYTADFTGTGSGCYTSRNYTVNSNCSNIAGFKTPTGDPAAANQKVSRDGGISAGGDETTANPFFFPDISAGSHTISVPAVSGYATTYSACQETATGCTDLFPEAQGTSTSVNCPSQAVINMRWNYRTFSPPTFSGLPACITDPQSGNSLFNINWTNPASPANPVSYVDISPNINFNPLYNKAVSSTTTTAPNGFYRWPDSSSPLIIMPSLTYYVRLYNGDPNNQSPSAPFSIPRCVPAITPWIQVWGDVHSNTAIRAPGGP